MNIIARGLALVEAATRFTDHARQFFYKVVLSAHMCPKCNGKLGMVAEGRCKCHSCGHEFDPTPEFQGYVIVICDFQYGHGYAFITDGFGSIPTLAQGYLALIITTDNDGDREAGCNADGERCGENLNQ